MSLEHTFLGTWEIISCTFEGKREVSGLEGIKFRLDNTSDITWYNDLVSPLPEIIDCSTCNDTASVLFSCETFDVRETNPRLVFGAYAGHSIEFSTSTLMPTDYIVLSCENWYSVECKRLQDDRPNGQERQFSFGEALLERYFSDVVVKSCTGFEYALHSSILRLNGFDCSMCASNTLLSTSQNLQPLHFTPNISKLNPINISIGIADSGKEQSKHLQGVNLSSVYMQPVCDFQLFAPTAGLETQRFHYFSSSFNRLTNVNMKDSVETVYNADGGLLRMCTSHSESHLEISQESTNIFNFCQDLLQPVSSAVLQSSGAAVCNTRRPPLSPYRLRSSLPLSNLIDTPPSSPLTPVGVLFNLPTFLLNPILHWLYTESLLPELDEGDCEKLINFCEAQPSLTKLVPPTRKYLRLLRLKKLVENLTMDLHNILNRIIQYIDPVTISYTPALLYATFQNGLRECALGCVKMLQFCKIFINDATHLTRYQKNEIVRFVRSRIPIFISQVLQLLRNTLEVFIGLNINEKEELVNYLVPEIEITLRILTTVIEEIKNSMETICKNFKCNHIDESQEQEHMNNDIAMQMGFVNETILSPRPRHCPPFGTALYENHSEQRFGYVESDLKFVLYMYGVKNMRDICGRITTALEIIKAKNTFCEMDVFSKRSTIKRNLEKLILDIPTYISTIENLSDRLDDKLGWKQFKFCFKLATSQINGVIAKLLDHKLALRQAIEQICKVVRKQEFLMSIIELGLLEPSNQLLHELKLADSENNLDKLDQGSKGTKPMNQYHEYINFKLNLIRNLCEPPIAAHSNLSKNALRLLHSAQMADMEFEVHTYASSTSSDKVWATLMVSHIEDKNASLQVHSFKAHRVIVAARCEWFKKALMSGMQESIKRKVVITDTSPVIFRRLLLYIYGAPIDRTVGADQICELMLLADRYSIDNLKEICESTLNSLIDEDSVVVLLGIADRYFATLLKSNCISFLSKHAHLTKSEIFKELPQALQVEVIDLVNWFGRAPEPWNDYTCKPRSSSRHSFKSPSVPHSRKSSPSSM
ncbi:uncharacterized protein Dmoj_GI14159, isoform D [Drosophila mojavensis]|uniref:Uncharacterized protein, isoform D n=1 Tax=Drosophila mojavensis TaxID=7230 RepID=A0A0Q9XHQ4_DROMO|nr:uncharacterized protein Dmoj_GI14159, isoform D [Drosophila mojavensis]